VLVAAQLADSRAAELDYQEKLRSVAADQLNLENARAEALAGSLAYMEELSTRQSVGAGLQQGLAGYVGSVENLRDAVGKLTTDSIGGLEAGLVELATTGKANYREFAASVLQDTARMIIRQLVLRSIMQLIGGIGGGGVAQSFEMPSAAFMPSGGYAFAKGGVFTEPTLFRFAAGGSFRQGLMGEAGPEAVMPLRRGPDGRLGVSASGGGSTSITINVDASGTTAQGDQGKSGALARDLARVVDDRLTYHRLPGGMLAA
jgi:lambda family phage tail tape measure protein